MPTISNIPPAMLYEHVHWHMNVHSMEPLPQQAFLVWHNGYIKRFHNWVGSLPSNERPDSGSIEPWLAVPNELKEASLGWNQVREEAEDRLQQAVAEFDSLEALGVHIQQHLHGWMHVAGETLWSEPMLRSYVSPISTYFWQLHGLIDHWLKEWIGSRSDAEMSGVVHSILL